jgi:DNA-binding NtrC family response regulator
MVAILSPVDHSTAEAGSEGIERGGDVSLQGAVSEAAEEIEKRMIQEALRAHDGRRQQAADALKISRKSLHNKMKKYGIE